MPSSSYLDTSYLLKAYVLESNSDQVSEYIRTPGPDLLITSLTDVELASALTRKLPSPDGREAFEDYLRDKRVGLFRPLELTTEVYELAQGLALDLSSRFLIRSLDILPLAVATYSDANFFATYDGRLATAAYHLGMSVIGARP